MLFNVFPIKTVLFQFLFLLITISLEGLILRRLLRLGRRTSIEYSASINLLTVFLGWLTFFFILPFLPEPLRGVLISYIFFDRLIPAQIAPFYTLLVIIAFGIFLAAYIIKIVGLRILQILLGVPITKVSSIAPTKTLSNSFLPNRSPERQVLKYQANQAVAVLLANACSHTVISLLLVLIYIQIHYYQP